MKVTASAQLLLAQNNNKLICGDKRWPILYIIVFLGVVWITVLVFCQFKQKNDKKTPHFFVWISLFFTLESFLQRILPKNPDWQRYQQIATWILGFQNENGGRAFLPERDRRHAPAISRQVQELFYVELDFLEQILFLYLFPHNATLLENYHDTFHLNLL